MTFVGQGPMGKYCNPFVSKIICSLSLLDCFNILCTGPLCNAIPPRLLITPSTQPSSTKTKASSDSLFPEDIQELLLSAHLDEHESLNHSGAKRKKQDPCRGRGWAGALLVYS